MGRVELRNRRGLGDQAGGVPKGCFLGPTNQALTEGRIVAGPNGILPGKGLGAILEVNGVKVQLIGGRVMNGVVELGSFVGL